MSASDKQRDARLRRLYGLTLRQYELMEKRQGNHCAICEKPPNKARLNVDHDHKSGRVRGLLCFYCNKRRVGRDREEHAVFHDRVAAYLRSGFDGRKL